MLCPSCGTNVGTEARLCRGCSASPNGSSSRGTSSGGVAETGLANTISSSIMGVALMLGLLAFSFGLVLQKIFDKVSLFDGVLIALTTAFLVASVMGRAFINGARIAVPARIVHALVAIMFFYCAVELYRRPIVEYALARTKTSIETYESVKNFERSAEWLTTVKDELKEGAGKIKSAVKP